MQKTNFKFVIIFSLLLLMLVSCGPVNFGQLQTQVPSAQTTTTEPNGQIYVPAMSIQINAPGPNPFVMKPNATGQVAGVLIGLWHGIMAPVTMVLSFIYPKVQMYEVFNNGSQYNLGFLLGLVLFLVVLASIVGLKRR